MAQNRGLEAEPPATNRFLQFPHKKNTHLSTLSIDKGRNVPAVSAVSNRQCKNIFVGSPKSLGTGVSKSRCLAQINKRRMQLYQLWRI